MLNLQISTQPNLKIKHVEIEEQKKGAQLVRRKEFKAPVSMSLRHLSHSCCAAWVLLVSPLR